VVHDDLVDGQPPNDDAESVSEPQAPPDGPTRQIIELADGTQVDLTALRAENAQRIAALSSQGVDLDTVTPYLLDLVQSLVKQILGVEWVDAAQYRNAVWTKAQLDGIEAQMARMQLVAPPGPPVHNGRVTRRR
jgi:hypothetical protein